MSAKGSVVVKHKMKQSLGSRIFDVCNVIFMLSLILVILIPLIHVVSASFSNPSSYVRHEGLMLHPVDFHFYRGGGNCYQYYFHVDCGLLSVPEKCDVEQYSHDRDCVQHVFQRRHDSLLSGGKECRAQQFYLGSHHSFGYQYL